jgi:hypothetical protein
MSKKKSSNYCVDCGKKLKTHSSKRCYSCENKRKHRVGILHLRGNKSSGYKHGKYCKKYHCIDCGKQINVLSKRCWQYEKLFNKGKNHYNYKKEVHQVHYCKNKNCNNKISYNNWRDGSKRCRTCAGKLHSIRMKRNPFTSKSLANHHIYLKEHSNKMLKLTYSKHAKLHNSAYEYLYVIQGKKGIDNYLKWFDKKYGLNI